MEHQHEQLSETKRIHQPLVGRHIVLRKRLARQKTGQWIDASFHFLEQVEFYKPGQESALAPEGCSVFKWNDLVFQNFREGNLKILDFHFYRSLESRITKRLFRFLDKRFYKRKMLSFDLEVFACEKIGLTRPIKINPAGRATTDIAQIKRRLLKSSPVPSALHRVPWACLVR